MEQHLLKVNELPLGARSAVESLVGHPLGDSQQLYIAAFDAPSEPTAEDRRSAWEEMRKMISLMQENARQSGLTAEEIDRLIDSECDAVRYGA